MNDLIQQAEALEAQADNYDKTAALCETSARQVRAEAAKLREQAREPLRLWANSYNDGSVGTYDSECAAQVSARNWKPTPIRIAVPMVEVRPVRITDAELLEKWTSHVLVGHSELAPRLRAFINALSLAGVEVEK